MMNRKVRVLSHEWLIAPIFVTVFYFAVSSHADTWRDDFTGDQLKDAWTVDAGARSFRWEVEAGFLHVKQTAGRGGFPRGELALSGFPGPYQQLTITATLLKTTRVSFGIDLVKKILVHGERNARWVDGGYSFQTNLIDNLYTPWIPRHPGTRWDTLAELKEMVLIFNAGRFQMFGNGELRADFFDEHFDQIDVIKISLQGNDLVLADGWMDSFAISAPSLAVDPKGKLATTWGALKAKR